MNPISIHEILKNARAQGRLALLETEGMDLLDAAGFRTPARTLFENSSVASQMSLPLFAGERAVIKVVSHEILHKSDLGGVEIVLNRRDDILASITAMEARFAGHYAVAGYSVSEFVPYDSSLGNELLLGMRFTEDFGPVVTLGTGGIHAEFLAQNFREGCDTAILSPELPPTAIGPALERTATLNLATMSHRGKPPKISLFALESVVQKFLTLAKELIPSEIREFEINPLVISRTGELVALDSLVLLSSPLPSASAPHPQRPVHKIKNLLEPKSAAVIGVSEKMNPGRVILRNLLHEGFDPSRLYVVKPGLDQLDGCRCVPKISDLPERVDLMVLAIAAHQVPETITEIIQSQKAESLIVIPGGLEEKEGTAEIVASMRAVLERSRTTEWKGPVINGGNCLGIRSLPGKYNTLFLPPYKLPLPQGAHSPIALLSQSGAFAVSKISKLGAINPKYAISIGNQMDLTIGDYLSYLKDDPELRVFAVYVEGFKPLDGQLFLKAAREISESGRTVVLYRAGRTSEGAKASASHTASIAGNYPVTRELCRAAGIVVADSLADFEDLTKLHLFLLDRRPQGMRLGAISNAGFECVAFADNLNGFTLPAFQGASQTALEHAFAKSGISSIVDVHNPVDLTPMSGDAAYEAVTRAVLADPGVDAAVVSAVPLTQAMNTLPKSAAGTHREDLTLSDSFVGRCIAIWQESKKPWVVVIDSGELYDPMAYALERAKIPIFRTADRALRLFSQYCQRTKTRT